MIAPMRPAVRLVPATAALLFLAGCPASGCRYDTDCPGAKVCLQGRCQESPAVAVAAGGRCAPGIPCARSEVCVSGVCEPQGSQVTQPCTSSRDPNACPSGQVCAVSGRTARCAAPPCTALNACIVFAGRVKPAHACAADGDCQTGWCLDHACASACAATRDCPSGFTCQSLTETPPGGSAPATVRVCVPANPSVVTCDGDRFCQAGQSCQFDLGSTAIAESCNPTPQGGIPTGRRCSKYFTGCESNVCLNNQICTGPCLDSNDCPAALTCDVITFNGWPGNPQLPGCVVPANGCLDDAMCATRSGKVCSLAVSVDNHHLLLACGPGSGPGAPGATCSSGLDCASGICGSTGVCTQPCLDDSDCTVTGWTCGTMAAPVPAGGTETLHICIP